MPSLSSVIKYDSAYIVYLVDHRLIHLTNDRLKQRSSKLLEIFKLVLGSLLANRLYRKNDLQNA